MAALQAKIAAFKANNRRLQEASNEDKAQHEAALHAKHEENRRLQEAVVAANAAAAANTNANANEVRKVATTC